jgi:hypothetical protein
VLKAYEDGGGVPLKIADRDPGVVVLLAVHVVQGTRVCDTSPSGASMGVGRVTC